MLPPVAAVWLALPGLFPVLVAQLGHADFRQREAAARRLDALGEAALPALGRGKASPNPEVARRSAALAAVIAKRADAARTLAPTLVDLPAGDRPLADVLADIRKQTGIAVHVPDVPADARTTTVGGPVPFWSAVAQLRGLGVDTKQFPAVTLVPRSPRATPPYVSGAVSVEVRPFPDAALAAVPRDNLALVVQCFPEPKVPWERVDRVRVTKATDDAGRELFAVSADPAEPVRVYPTRGRFEPVRAPDPVPEHRPDLATPDFAPNPGQGFVRLRAVEPGTRTLRAFEGSVRGVVRTGVEELASLAGPTDTAEGANGVVVKVVAAPDGAPGLIASVRYNPQDVRLERPLEMTETVVLQVRGRGRMMMRRVGGEWDGSVPAAEPAEAQHGLAVLDGTGRPILLTATGTLREVTPDGWHTDTVRLTPVIASSKGDGKAAKVTFSAARSKAVEVPFKFRGVPVASGQGS